MEHRWNVNDRGDRGILRKTCPNSTSPTQIPHGLAWIRTWTSTVESRE